MSQNDTIALYIHWPFCLSKCPYCDFNSHVRAQIDEAAFLRCYLRELDHYAALTSDKTLHSIFFGGGTPSLMSPHLVEQIITHILKLWRAPKDLEITLEANPTSVEEKNFKGYHTAGVNRVSLGIQSLRDGALKQLGRAHSVVEAKKALTTARTVFERFSFDLIYARENQTLDDWRDELSEALELAGDHLSLYQLTIEPGTAFQGRFNKGQLVLPPENLAEEMFFLTQDMTAKAGLPAYEISNHAQDKNRSRHNMAYWQGRAYIGIGPGAHGRVAQKGGLVATNNWKKPEAWLRAVEAHGHGQESQQNINPYERSLERLMMGLRITEGVKRRDIIDGVLDEKALQYFQEQGLLELDARTIRLNKRGLCLLDYILPQIIL